MKKLFALMASGILLSHAGNAQCRLNYSNYYLAFEESFNNISSVSQLTSRWKFQDDDPNFGWGNEWYSPNQISIQPGGILRLTATKITDQNITLSNGNTRSVGYRSGMIQSILSYDPNCWPGNPYGWGGFLYGMFEARIKLPKGTAWPAFWINDHHYSEIDVLEGRDDRYISNGVIDWTKPDGAPHRSCYAEYAKDDRTPDLSQDFHTYTCVWTPTKVSFFFDGVLQRTVPSSTVALSSCPANIMISFETNPWSNMPNNTGNMDIDYIRVYKPVGGNYAQSYNSSYESVGFDAFENATGTLTGVNSAPNSIAVNTNNPDEVFYRGTDNYIYQALKSGTTWNIKRLLYNDGAPVLAKGDVRYLPQQDLVVYVGENNRINLFGRSTQTSTGFYHWYITSNWNCYWCVTDDQVYPAEGSLQTTPNGEIFYKGTDSKLHRYYPSGGQWVHQILPSAYNGTDIVKGDIVVDPLNNTNTVYYKGTDNRLQVFWKNGQGTYVHDWIDNNWGTTAYCVNTKPGSMTWSKFLNGVLYAGTDNKLHLFAWNQTWSHTLIPINYGVDDYINGNIDWNDADRVLYYVGVDGRMQATVSDYSTGNWLHYHTDNYYNTGYYWSYKSTESPKASSVKCVSAGAGAIFYSKYDGHLAYFKYGPCEKTDVPCSIPNHPYTYLRSISTGHSIETTAAEVKIAPNPATDYFTVTSNVNDLNVAVTITNTLGQVVITENNLENNSRVDISRLPKGIYVVSLTGKNINTVQKLVKN